MCGIAGYFGSRRIEKNVIHGCLRVMGRRGPDHASYRQWTNPAQGHVYLLHSRLSIIDLNPRANQPFGFGSRWLVFNGEVYNYLEVKQDLARRGHSFETESDTEVLAHALVEWDGEALDRCEGMWAFALYDESKGTLLLGRDRFGEKPLYVFRDETGFYFGSEVKFIAALRGRGLGINFNHLYRYLVNGYKSMYKGRETFFRGLEELPPASVVLMDSGGVETRSTYWQPRFLPHDALSYEEAVEGVKEAVIESLRLRLRADVPLAFCMSGGVDSNSLIGVAKKVFKYDVHGFTLLDEDPRYNEAELVQYSGKELGIRQTTVPAVKDDFILRLRTLVRQHDAPVYTITYYAHWLLMTAIAEHGYRISVSGTGADELLTGYYDHHNAYLYEIRENAALSEESLENWRRHIQPIVRNPFLQNPRAFIENPDMRDHIFLDAPGFARYLREPWEERFVEHTFCPGLLRNRMLNELFHEVVPPILHEDDLNAMYYSIENRSPFLDRRLFEFCAQIPTRFLIKDGFAKAVLRDAMKGIVPDRILTQHRKVGFNAAISSFLDTRSPEVRDYLLDGGPIFEHVRKNKIEALIDKTTWPNSESKFLFNFLNSKIFLEEFGRVSTD